MMAKLHSVPGLRGLLAFVRTTYVRPTTYVWEDGDGVKHQIHQAEGGEQGDPLMPLLFRLAIHDALANVQSRLRPREYIFAFLNDVYGVTSPGRSRAIYNLLAEQLWAVAGIRLHTGKTRVWNRAAERLPPPTWTISGMMCGTLRASKSLAHQSGHHSLFKVPSTRGWRTRRSCGMSFHGSWTCSRVGRSSSSAQSTSPPPPANSAPFSVCTLRG